MATGLDSRLQHVARTLSGTPWISFYAPEQIVAVARDAGFASAHTVATAELAARYLTGRTDGLRPAGGEGILVART